MSLLGQKFGEFDFLEKLGEGGMGTVYKGRQSALKRLVAIKVLQARLATDSEYVTRFNNEAVAAAALAHPNLVQVYAAGETKGVHWFAMEYVDGESVQNRLERMGKLPHDEAVAICMHVVAGLSYGWKKAQLIHRDIKPDNIFLSNDGEVKLGDLGLAKSISQENSLTMTGASMGTPLYISPEQTEGRKDVTFSTDIYSLGCTLFHLLSGRAPYHGETPFAVMLKHVSAPIPDLLAECSDCTGALAAVVQKMMAKNPSDRHGSYEELAGDLQAAYLSIREAHQNSAPLVVATANPEKSDSLPRNAPQVAGPKKANLALRVALGCLVVVLTWLFFLKSGVRQLIQSSPVEKHRTIDLLALVDPVRDKIESPLLGKNGRWEKDGPLLRYVGDKKPGKVVCPVALDATEYVLEIHYKRLEATGRWHADIPLPDERVVPLILDEPGQKVVHSRDGPQWPTGLPPTGKLLVHVKLGEGEEPDALDFDLGDAGTLAPWRGRLRDLSRAIDGHHRDFPTERMTSLVSFKESYEFSRWTLTVLKGDVRVLR